MTPLKLRRLALEAHHDENSRAVLHDALLEFVPPYRDAVAEADRLAETYDVPWSIWFFPDRMTRTHVRRLAFEVHRDDIAKSDLESRTRGEDAFVIYTAPPGGNEQLAYLLDREVRAIGPERAADPPAPGVALLMSPDGSYRYVAMEGDMPVSALQIMSRNGREGVIENVYTSPHARRRGWARKLLELARKRFRQIEHSDDLSTAGAGWARAVESGRSRSRLR